MLNVQIADHVRYRSQEHGGVVILDISAGEWVVLNQTAGELWRSWEAGADFGQAVSRIAERYPGVPEAVIRADAEQLLGELVRRRLVVSGEGGAAVLGARGLVRGAAAQPHGMGGRSVGAAMAAPQPSGSRALSELCRGVLALVFLGAADMLLRCSYRRSVALVRVSRSSWCRSAMPPQTASRTVEAVRRAAHWYPWRAACLERSLAAVLLGIVVRRRLDWCLGSVPDPYRFHAWVAVDGEPVAAADDDPALDQWDLVLNV